MYLIHPLYYTSLVNPVLSAQSTQEDAKRDVGLLIAGCCAGSVLLNFVFWNKRSSNAFPLLWAIDGFCGSRRAALLASAAPRSKRAPCKRSSRRRLPPGGGIWHCGRRGTSGSAFWALSEENGFFSADKMSRQNLCLGWLAPVPSASHIMFHGQFAVSYGATNGRTEFPSLGYYSAQDVSDTSGCKMANEVSGSWKIEMQQSGWGKELASDKFKSRTRLCNK